MKRSLIVVLAMGCSIHLYDSGDPNSTTVPSGGPDPGPDAGLLGTTCPTAIDPYRELLVIDPSVLGDARAKNETDGAWSFRARIEEIAGAHAGDATLAWLEQWKTTRPNVESVLVDPWRAASTYGLDPAKAPFRLIAIVNRIDLRDDPAACVGGAGELRFVYTAVDLPMTVIFEIPYPKTRPVRDWAAAWHALGTVSFGAEYNNRLEQLTRSVTDVVEARTIRVRTNESAFGDGWEMREFAASAEGSIDQVPLDQTPRQDLDGTSALGSWVQANADAVNSGTWMLPTSMRAAASPIPSASFRWSVPGAPDALRSAFDLGTCNGCHGGETTALPFQHLASISYYGDTTQVSPFLVKELGRRGDSMTNALCSTCDTTSGTGNPYGPEPGSPSCSK